MAERIYYSKAGPIDPFALVHENIAIWLKSQWHCYRVRYLEPLPKSHQLVFDQGILAAGASSGDVRLINLDQQTTPPAIAQLRFFPLDDIRVTVKVGVAEARFTTARVTAEADRLSILSDPDLHLTEIVVLQQNSVYVNCTAVVATNMSRVAFFGYRYLLDDLDIAVPTPADVKTKVGQAVVFVPSGSD